MNRCAIAHKVTDLQETVLVYIFITTAHVISSCVRCKTMCSRRVEQSAIKVLSLKRVQILQAEIILLLSSPLAPFTYPAKINQPAAQIKALLNIPCSGNVLD